MKLKLNSNWIDKLLHQPETGMGYQEVDIILKSGEKLCNVIIYNAEIVELPSEYSNLRLADISNIIVHSKPSS
jgi:hypothetical protein